MLLKTMWMSSAKIKARMYSHHLEKECAFFDSAWLPSSAKPRTFYPSLLTPYRIQGNTPADRADFNQQTKSQAKAFFVAPIVCTGLALFAAYGVLQSMALSVVSLITLDANSALKYGKEIASDFFLCLYAICSAVLDTLVAFVSIGTRFLATVKKAQDGGSQPEQVDTRPLLNAT